MSYFNSYIIWKVKNERSNIDSVLQVSVNANKQVYSLLRRKNEMCEALRELMKDEIEKELENKLEHGRKTATNSSGN